MDEVIEQDPKNLAPLLFRMILARKKSPKESIEPWLDAADEANFYDDYTRDFAQVLRLATQRPVFYLQVVGAWSISPMPNYRPMVELFQSLGVRSSRYGVLMLQQGLEAKGRGSDIDWSVVPYEFGLLGIKKGDPGKEKLYPRAKDLLKKYGIQNKGTEFLKLLDSPDCSMQKFLDYLAEI
jgi:hypothetical protein